MLARKREVKRKNASGPRRRPNRGRDEFGLLLSLFQYLFRCFRITGRQQGGCYIYSILLQYTTGPIPPSLDPLSLSGAKQRGKRRRRVQLSARVPKISERRDLQEVRQVEEANRAPAERRQHQRIGSYVTSNDIYSRRLDSGFYIKPKPRKNHPRKGG